MPADRALFDNNVLIYAFAEGDWRRETALGLLLAGGTPGVQTLNGFVNDVAAALEAFCTVSYSEDMRDRQKIGGMTIRNPFARA